MSDLFIFLNHPLFDAVILRQGAQLIHFQPKGKEPLLWSSELSTFEKGKAFRGGIPLCWPWFGKAGSPAHGFARIVEWDVVDCIENEEGIKILFELSDSVQTRTLWPYAFTTRLVMSLGHDVKLLLHVNAESESTAALHTYIACNHINDVTVSGLGSFYKDSLRDGLLCESHDETLSVEQAIDRIYTQPEVQSIFNEKEHILNMTHDNHSDVVVWNPWMEGVVKLSDMKEDDYTKMLCIESARISRPLQCEDHLEVKITIVE